MLKALVRCFVLSLVCSFISSPIFAQCGVERWSVKTGTDPDAGKVNLSTSTSTTIATMRSWTAPNPIPSNSRVSPSETTQWVLNATLTQYKLESDSDYHLVIQDSAGNTMIAEIPAPNCVGAGSPFGPGITNSRNEFDAKFTATTSFQTANIPVQIKGVGMFDFLHGQTGVAPNGIEIHPVLDIVFNPGSGGGVTTLTNGQTVTNLSGATGSFQYFKITVPSGQTSLKVTESGGTGDADLYLKLGAQPTTTTYDSRSILSGNGDSITVTNPAAGDWYIGVYAYAAYSGLSLQATYSGGGGGSTQLLGNPGFETGTASPWTTSSGVINNSTSEPAHSGAWDAWMDGYGAAHTDTLLQQVAIPAGKTSATLSFYLHVDTAETTTTTAYDTLKVQIRNSSGTVLATLATYSNLNANTGYALKSFNLNSYIGQTIQVYLVGAEDSTLQTSFVVDDFALNVQ
jgi:hypothetical protein